MIRSVTPTRSRLGATVAFALAISAIAGSGAVLAQSAGPSGSTEPAASLPAPGSAGAVTIGSNYSDAVPKAAFQAMVDYCAAQTGTTVTVNTTEHGKFQDNLTTYLQGTPDDIFTWFAGF